jgi:hypothetical protein
LKEKKEKSLQFQKKEIRKKKTNFERTLIERTTYPALNRILNFMSYGTKVSSGIELDSCEKGKE